MQPIYFGENFNIGENFKITSGSTQNTVEWNMSMELDKSIKLQSNSDKW